jgi:hypothetical protein
MTGWELGNCRRYGLDPIVVLFNNKSWEMLRVFQPESRFNDLDDWRFAALAPSLGGHGQRVETRRELEDALEQRWRGAGNFRWWRSCCHGERRRVRSRGSFQASRPPGRGPAGHDGARRMSHVA